MDNYVWRLIMRQSIVTRFTPRYLSGIGNTDILPKYISSLISDEKLNHDKRLALKNSIRSHDYNKTRFDENRKIIGK